ncbi:MAG: hypothetical protein D6754_07810 [Alphaproteobacteria bacterium]|nr:MAG: hypothetical protein D6754_07810 [Alphaproteobacteria bacterium]
MYEVNSNSFAVNDNRLTEIAAGHADHDSEFLQNVARASDADLVYELSLNKKVGAIGDLFLQDNTDGVALIGEGNYDSIGLNSHAQMQVNDFGTIQSELKFTDDSLLSNLQINFQYLTTSNDRSGIAGSSADIPDDRTTTASMRVQGRFFGQLETYGDRDWIKVKLDAGTTYWASLKGIGSNALSDPYLNIYDRNGNLIFYDDDGGPGRNSLEIFTASYTGTYYLEARAYSYFQTGEYQLHIDTGPDFLDSIDWGTQVSTSSIDVYFAQSGDTFAGYTSASWSSYEQQQAMLALQQIANVANVSFHVTSSSWGAEFKLLNVDGTQFPPNVGGRMLAPGEWNEGVGVFNYEGLGWDWTQPGTGGLEQGGLGFVTLIHELGHGMGLAHPHDTAGNFPAGWFNHEGSTIWSGVTSQFNSYGDFDLNQGVYTTMTYNDGWATGPLGAPWSYSYGLQGTMMAFDIAVLQQKYGANTNYHKGNNTYFLPNSNGVGTFYSSIWDAGGNADRIRYIGHADAVIDLRAAHLGYGPGSGGYISHASGIHGGYTIANGVVIEQGWGGNGNDHISGNFSKNILKGLGGRDYLFGRGGKDKIFGGGGNDKIYGGSGNDMLWGNDDRDVLAGGGGNDILVGGRGADIQYGGGGRDTFKFTSTNDSGFGASADKIGDFSAADWIDLSDIDANTTRSGNQAFHFIGHTGYSGHAGELRYWKSGGDVIVTGDVDGDAASDFSVRVLGISSLNSFDFLL